MIIRRAPDIRSSEITDEKIYLRRREFMRLAGLFVDDVLHANVQRHEHVGDDAAVATPPERLGAHGRRRTRLGQAAELGEAGTEILGQGMVGEVAEGLVAPHAVRRGRRAGRAVAKPAEGLQMPMTDPGRGQRRR